MIWRNWLWDAAAPLPHIILFHLSQELAASIQYVSGLPKLIAKANFKRAIQRCLKKSFEETCKDLTHHLIWEIVADAIRKWSFCTEYVFKSQPKTDHDISLSSNITFLPYFSHKQELAILHYRYRTWDLLMMHTSMYVLPHATSSFTLN